MRPPGVREDRSHQVPWPTVESSASTRRTALPVPTEHAVPVAVVDVEADGHRLAPPRRPVVLGLEEPPHGRPTVPADVRALIRTMSQTDPLWGAPRIHGELLKLGH